MAGPRKPRDLDNYTSPRKAAAMLRKLADSFDKDAGHIRVKVHVKVHLWDGREERADGQHRPTE